MGPTRPADGSLGRVGTVGRLRAAVALATLVGWSLLPVPPAHAALSRVPVVVADGDDVNTVLDVKAVTYSANEVFLNLTVETYEAWPANLTYFTWLLDTNDDGSYDIEVAVSVDPDLGTLFARASPRTGEPIKPAAVSRTSPTVLDVRVGLADIGNPTSLAYQVFSLVDANRDGAIQNGEIDVAGMDGQGDLVYRFAGPDRVTTALAVSEATFRGAAAGAVVLAGAESFADALSGAPLAANKGGPLLLTPGAALDPAVEAEIRRVLPAGRVVYLLGGATALSDSTATRVAGLGYNPIRLSGPDRFETALDIARRGLNNPSTLVLASGATFIDGLSAGAAAASRGGALLLTDGPTMPASVSSYIASRAAVTRYAVGGPAATADPGAIRVVGPNRYATSRLAAELFFSRPTRIGITTGLNFPDALSGGANMGYVGGPLLLTPPTQLDLDVEGYLAVNAGAIAVGAVFGGRLAVSDAVRTAVATAIK